VLTFGPVNSRRFGISLGIDLSPKEKSCNYDCVYCELKASKPVSSIKNPPKVEDVINEVQAQLKAYPEVEVITITSNGEPTLYPDLELLVDELNKIKDDKKTLILSNGSTVCSESIKKALKKIDIVKLSLDCATSGCFKKIDRPLKDIELQKLVGCMKTLEVPTLVLEILVVKGINDKEKEFVRLNKILQDIKPDRVDIGTIDRPPAYKVQKVSEDRLKELSNLITNIPLSLIRKNSPSKKESFSKEGLLNLLKHRPQSIFDVESFFDENSKEILSELLSKGLVKKDDVAGVIFFKIV